MISIKNDKFPNYHCKKTNKGSVAIFRDGNEIPLKPLQRYKKEIVYQLYVNGRPQIITLFEYLRQALTKL